MVTHDDPFDLAAPVRLLGEVIRVDIEPEQMTRNVLPAISICADAGLTMQAMSTALAGMTPFEHQAEVASVREAAELGARQFSG